MFCFQIVLFAFVSVGYGLNEDYFWREYTGTIPTDAIVAGKNKNGQDTYIGQAYIQNRGIIVSQIYRGNNEVLVPISGVVKTDKYIKILCGPQENFSWLSANTTSLHLILINKHAVVGGHEDGIGVLNIGRLSFEGEIKIGKVIAGQPGDSPLYFTANKDKEHRVDSYEVLVYSENRFDIRIANR